MLGVRGIFLFVWLSDMKMRVTLLRTGSGFVHGLFVCSFDFLLVAARLNVKLRLTQCTHYVYVECIL